MYLESFHIISNEGNEISIRYTEESAQAALKTAQRQSKRMKWLHTYKIDRRQIFTITPGCPHPKVTT